MLRISAQILRLGRDRLETVQVEVEVQAMDLEQVRL